MKELKYTETVLYELRAQIHVEMEDGVYCGLHNIYERIEEIWTIVIKAFENGQSSIPVHIFPFRMSDENLCRFKDSEWYDFWLNLKEGFDYFENKKYPPKVTVNNRKYYFN